MRIARLLLLLLLSAGTVYGQTITGTILGNVTDQTGAVLPGVTVTIRNLDTNQVRTTVTTDSGNYTVPLLPVGRYEVSGELPGFKTQVRSGIELQVEQRLNINFGMAVGDVTERLVVTEAAPLVQTDSATVGSVVDTQKLVELPLNGRLFSQVAVLVPATTTLPPGDGMGIPQRGGFSVAGNRTSANNFLIDGIDNNDISINIASVKPSVDSVQEFKILSGTYSSEFGRGGGAQINVITKSGGNDIHGVGYFFIRDEALDARNFFDKPGEPKPLFSRKQFGGTLGGPIVKNRTFFYGSYEGLRLEQGITRTALVPLPAMKTGDLSSLLPAVIVRDPLTGLAFPNNRIPPERINPSGREMVKLFPDPNLSGAGNNYVSAPSDRFNWNLWSVRINHRLTDNNSFFGRINSDNLNDLIAWDPFNPANLPGYGRNNPVTAENIGIIDTHIFSPNLINELRLGYGYLRENKSQQNKGIDVTEQQLGIKGTSRDPNHFGYPRIDITGYGTLGEPTNEPQDRRVHTYQIYNGLSWIRARHTLKFGADVRRIQNNFNFNSTVRGSFNFTGRYSGSGIGDTLLGYPSVVSINRGNTQRYFRASSINWFVQDDFKFSSRLTLNLGVRYEINTAPFEKDDKLSNFNPKTNQIELAGKDMPRGLYSDDLNNFGPRLGLAYNLTPSGSAVVRAGYGIYYNQQSWSPVLVGSSTSYPFVTPLTFNASLTNPPNITLRDPFPEQLVRSGVSLFAQDRDFRSAYMQQWSAGLQHELPYSMVFEVSYLGNKATKLDISRPINQPRPGPGPRPFPQYANLNLTESSANSNYNAMILRAEKRFSEGLTFLSAYTFSKAIADQTSPDMLNNRLGRGPADIDNRHRFVTNFLYEIPFGRDLDGAAAIALKGWQMSGILTLRSGQAVTPRLTIDNSRTLFLNDRPDLVGDWTNSNPDPQGGWWNRSAFVIPAAGNFGNAGTGILHGPDLRSFDFSLMKTFSITESKRAEFRAEFFNLTNHPNFARPETAFNSANFGVVSQALESRQIQFGLKFVY